MNCCINSSTQIIYLQRKGNNKRRKNQNVQIKYENKLKLLKAKTNNVSISDFNPFSDNDDKHFVNGSRHYDYGTNLTYTNTTKADKEKQPSKWKILHNFNPPSSTTDLHIPTDGFFCDSPSKFQLFCVVVKFRAFILTSLTFFLDNEYAHFIVQRVNHNVSDSLFEINAMMAMCDLEIQLMNVNGYGDVCELDNDSKKCCRPWSLPNYVALLSNKTSCFDIDVSF